MSHLMKHVLLISVFLGGCIAAGSEVEEWKTVNLGGTFRVWGATPETGQGTTHYSFALEKTIDASGDLWLEVCYPDATQVAFRLNGYWFCDYGPLNAPPQAIEAPKDFATQTWQREEPTYMKVGHFYLLACGPHYILMQVMEFSTTERKVISRGVFYNTEEAHCAVTFRYFPPSKNLEELNARLAHHKAPVLQSLANILDGPVDHNSPHRPTDTNSPPKPSIMPETDEDKLPKTYDGFQAEAKAFMDAKPPQACVKECDALLARATDLDANIEGDLISLGAEIKSAEAKIKTLGDRLRDVTHLQIKDRIQTLIESLTKEKEKHVEDMKRWTSHRQELREARNNLYQYRAVLEIMEHR